MIINNKTAFPYPVLGHRNGIDSVATAELSGGQAGDDYVWTCRFELDNDDIDNLIKSGDAIYTCELDCPSTNLRKCFYPEIGGEAKAITIRVPNNSVEGRVHVIATAVATKSITGYRNSKSSLFYQGFSFDLEPGDILATFGSWDIELDSFATSFKRITSIVQIKLSDIETMEIDLGSKRSIVIELPKSQFGKHEGNLKNPYYKPALLSSIVFEALVYAIQQYHDHEDKTWARIIELKVRKDLGYDNFSDDIKDDPSLAFEIARKLLDDPYLNLYNLLDELDSSSSSDENESAI